MLTFIKYKYDICCMYGSHSASRAKYLFLHLHSKIKLYYLNLYMRKCFLNGLDFICTQTKNDYFACF